MVTNLRKGKYYIPNDGENNEKLPYYFSNNAWQFKANKKKSRINAYISKEHGIIFIITILVLKRASSQHKISTIMSLLIFSGLVIWVIFAVPSIFRYGWHKLDLGHHLKTALSQKALQSDSGRLLSSEIQQVNQ